MMQSASRHLINTAYIVCSSLWKIKPSSFLKSILQGALFTRIKEWSTVWKLFLKEEEGFGFTSGWRIKSKRNGVLIDAFKNEIHRITCLDSTGLIKLISSCSGSQDEDCILLSPQGKEEQKWKMNIYIIYMNKKGISHIFLERVKSFNLWFIFQ